MLKIEQNVRDLDLWVVDSQGISDSPTHSNLERTLGWIEKAQPKRAILAHLSHEMDYDSLKENLPANVEPAYDNMTLEI